MPCCSLNAATDLIVNGAELMSGLGDLGTGGSNEGHDHETLHLAEHLVDTYSHFFARASAAERFMSNTSLFEQIVATAQTLPSAQVRNCEEMRACW